MHLWPARSSQDLLPLLHLYYRSSMVASAPSSASFLMLWMKGVQRPVWVSASSRDDFVASSGGAGLEPAAPHRCSDPDSCCSPTACCVFAVCDGGVSEAAALGGASCLCWHSLSDSTSSRTMSGLSLDKGAAGMTECNSTWSVQQGFILACKVILKIPFNPHVVLKGCIRVKLIILSIILVGFKIMISGTLAMQD